MKPRLAFTDAWELAAPPERVVEVLAGVDEYDRWWPEVREIHRIDDSSGVVCIRSVIPIVLRLTLRREVERHEEGLLRVRVDGDLRGWTQWHVVPTPTGSLAWFTEEVTVTRPLLRALAGLPGVGRRALVANHEAMVRSGKQGLRAHLAATTRAAPAEAELRRRS